jgi:prepilin-type N-terminal cleavage/methylation domain-containing protein
VKRVAAEFWGAHAPRVLARRLAERTFSVIGERRSDEGFGEAPKPAREARALPRIYGFTLVELLIVMAIILVLAGLILATSSYVQKKGRRSRAEAEIAAMSAALENYKADNGVYPSNTATTGLNPIDSAADYRTASSYLYSTLTGDDDADPTTPAPAAAKNYFGGALKPNMLGPIPSGPNTYLRDPFGNSYGYSTAKAANPAGTSGFNPTFDLWSIADGAQGPDQTKWVKNW